MARRCPLTGEIYIANLPYQENVQSGKRPVIVAQNNIGNQYSPIIHVIPLSKRHKKASYMPTHVVLHANRDNGLKRTSVALVENTRPAPADCLEECLGALTPEEEERIRAAFRVQFPFAG